MLLRELSELNEVSEVHWFERPDVLPEILRSHRYPTFPPKKVIVHRSLDISVLGPITQGRAWAAKSLTKHVPKMIQWSKSANPARVLLDFHPMYIPPVALLEGTFYWYDLIDNFTKHNLYNERERALVRQKYEFVSRHANLVTGVTAAAIQGMPNARILPNRLLRPTARRSLIHGGPAEYDLGFLGFITDKFDIAFVERCSSLGLRILICGKAYKPEVARTLAKIKGVEVRGEFKSDDSGALISKFSVGIIPYLSDKSHDEAPIKLLQYLSAGRSVLVSQNFALTDARYASYVKNYNEMTDEGIVRFVSNARQPALVAQLEATAVNDEGMYWRDSLQSVLAEIAKKKKW